MALFGNLLNGVVSMFTSAAGDKALLTHDEDCAECNLKCGLECMCRYCHFSSCDICDDIDCDIRTCKDTCHGDKGGRFKNITPEELAKPRPMSPQRRMPDHVYNKPPSEMSKSVGQIKPRDHTTQPISTEIPATDGEKFTINHPKILEKLEKIANETIVVPVPIKSTAKPAAQIMDQPIDVEETKPKLAKRGSKFSIMRGASQGREIGEKPNPSDELNKSIDNGLNMTTMGKRKSIIRFRPKTKEKDKIILNQVERKTAEEKINIDDRKKMSLAGKLKSQFIHTKIQDMNTPGKLDDHIIIEKFNREKSDISKLMASVQDEIRAENYTEKDKLKENIKKDFANQESWQSYMTLLFADIKTGNAVELKSKSTSSATIKPDA